MGRRRRPVFLREELLPDVRGHVPGRGGRFAGDASRGSHRRRTFSENSGSVRRAKLRRRAGQLRRHGIFGPCGPRRPRDVRPRHGAHALGAGGFGVRLRVRQLDRRDAAAQRLGQRLAAVLCGETPRAPSQPRGRRCDRPRREGTAAAGSGFFSGTRADCALDHPRRPLVRKHRHGLRAAHDLRPRLLLRPPRGRVGHELVRVAGTLVLGGLPRTRSRGAGLCHAAPPLRSLPPAQPLQPLRRRLPRRRRLLHAASPLQTRRLLFSVVGVKDYKDR
mmetsp:Transcript_4144/g.12853  ORF Transcript_4144/g.12853 Transcript_4144/m.12853 type:complete len:276 (-) Transcript_4144:1439-2266(-)